MKLENNMTSEVLKFTNNNMSLEAIDRIILRS